MHLQKRFQQGLLAFATSLVVAGAAIAAPAPFAASPAIAALPGLLAAAAPAKPISVTANAVAVSRPVSQLAREQPQFDPLLATERPGPTNPMLKKGPIKPTQIPYGDRDAAIIEGISAPTVMPPTIVNFEGMNNTANGSLFGFTVSPPDTNGDVGRSHYVLTVNLAVQIYRLDGTPLTPPFKMSSLFSALGASNICATDDDGDPIVLYDPLADRWMISQFALTPPFHQCIAISQTSDPTGAYFVYDFVMPGNLLNDYPHFGVWPDAYYMTDNEFDGDTLQFAGAGVFAFDRQKLLVGDPTATYIYFDQPVALGIGGQLPSDLDGVPPPAGAGNIIAMFTANEFGDPGGDGLRLWEFKPNFANPGSSTYTELTSEAVPIPVAAFSPLSPAGRADIPQPGTTARLDSISDRLMYRLQYRNSGTHESLVVNHTVNVGPDTTLANYRAGVRYYELRRTGGPTGTWAIHEQGTHAPADGVHRWMGSAALDRTGNLAVGFSASAAATVFPSVRYAGRLVGDPPGSLFQGEADIIAGSRAQTNSGSRWGDYSMMGVDPVDDCTFWYTQEYYSAPAPAGCGAATQCWQTRVASFRYPTCSAAPLPRSISGTVTSSITGLPVEGVTVLAGNGFAGTTNAGGAYSISIPPGTYDMVTAKTGFSSASATGVVVPVPTVPNPPNPVRDFQIAGVPLLNIGDSNLSDDSRGGNDNGFIDIDECPVITPVASNVGGGVASNTTGVLSTTTANVTVPTATANYGNINPGSSAFPSTPFVFQTSPTFVAGVPIDLALTLTSDEGSWVQNYVVNTGQNVPFPPSGLTPPAPVPVPDDSPAGVNVTVPVSGVGLPVQNLRVALRVTHTWIGDIAIRLTSPNGVSMEVTGSIGGAGNSADNAGTNCPATDGNDLVYSDTALGPPPGGVNNVSGVFRPDNPLSAFRGIPAATANGDWVLNFRDIAQFDTGSVQCVAIFIDGITSTSGNCAALGVDDLFEDGFEDVVR